MIRNLHTSTLKKAIMEKMNNSHYKILLLMLALSFVIMYLAMFLNVDELNHIYFSFTRTYMSLLMVSPMALLMLMLMRKMYCNKKLNSIIIISSIAVFVFALTALRSQSFVSDEQYMKAMIPHHSSAILASKNANIKDPEVRALSDSIIKSQKEEISKMKAILNRMK